MLESLGNFLNALIHLILSLFQRKPAPTPPEPPSKPAEPPAGPALPPDNLTEPALPTPVNVLLIVFNPIMQNGQSLSEFMGWYHPNQLIAGFLDDLQECSYGLAAYRIVQRVDLEEFTILVDGFRYTPQTYLDVLQKTAPPHSPSLADYGQILSRFNVLDRVARREIDEVWIMAFPYAGFYESVMGGAGAFWCNGPVLQGTESCPRRFVVMGFSYERYVGEMLEAFGHRAESILTKTFERLSGEANLWQRFTRYDKIAPGKAACGTIHFAPNSERDYDWNNPRLVPSECYDWLLNFPVFRGDVRLVNADEWGDGNLRLHHTWWLKHLPHAPGRKNGIHHNWWKYVLDPNAVV